MTIIVTNTRRRGMPHVGRIIMNHLRKWLAFVGLVAVVAAIAYLWGVSQ